MTDTSEAFWTDARRRPNRGWMDRASAKADAWRAAHQPPAEPEPVTPDDDAVAGLDLAAYAQVRDQLGMRSAGEFVGLDRRHVEDASGFPNATDRSLSVEQRAALPGLTARTHDTNGYTPRQRGIDASLVESIGGIRGRGNPNTNPK